ncbi:MAG: arsinothricin resistance N-acetyltransferase ArsN1 family B [Pseudomonadota bacterium]
MQIRPARVEDAEAIQAIYAPIVETTTVSFEEVAPSVEEIAERIAVTSAHYPFLVATRDEQVIGYAYASQHRTRAAYRASVDVAVYVSAIARGCGVGRALYAELLPLAAQHGYHAAFAGIALPNPSSVALHEAAGFEPVGVYREVGRKFGRWLDVGWWQKRL